jgi:hypothetical protein
MHHAGDLLILFVLIVAICSVGRFQNTREQNRD